MPKLGIAYNSHTNKVWRAEGDKIFNEKFGEATIYCIEDVSSEMLSALIMYGNNVKYQDAVAMLLYDVLSQKGIHNS